MNAPMNIELTNAPKPCARVCGGMTACATGRIAAIAPTTHANPSAPSTAVAATEWVHHPTSARLKPEEQDADSRTARCGALRKARPVRRPTSGVRNSAGSAIAAINSAAVGRRRAGSAPRNQRLNQSPQPMNPKPIASRPTVTYRSVAICRNRVSACSVESRSARMSPSSWKISSTSARPRRAVGEAAGGERERRR